MPSVSAIVLTKDSERTIEACVKALKPAVDHVIVVDTGSSDKTVEIAKDSGGRVYHFDWIDNFAAARNFGDSLAVTDWVMQVDSDEILRAEDTDKIRKACAQYKKTLHPIAVGVKLINVLPDRMEVNTLSRLYKRGTLVWRGIIHEQLQNRHGGTRYMIPSDIEFIHDGYDPSVVNVKEKIKRNITLLKKGVEIEPDNGDYHYFLGRDRTYLGEFESAIPHLERAIELLSHQEVANHLEPARKLLSQCLVRSKHLTN